MSKVTIRVRLIIVWLSVCLSSGLQLAHADHWISESSPEGADGALCEALHKRLNSLSQRCSRDAIETFPGFTDPPWEELDPKEHEDLVAKLLKYWQVGPRKYFDSSIPHSDSEDAAYRRRAATFISDGGRLRIWRTRLVPTFDYRPAPPSEQTVVLLSDHIPLAVVPNECPGESSKGWVRGLFLVTTDLFGPNPDIDAGNASILYSRSALLHEGVPYLVNSDTVFRGFGDAGLNPVCGFKQVKERARAGDKR